MNLLNLEEEKFKNITVRGYNFKIHYISPMKMIQYTQKRMQLQGGNSVESLTQVDFNNFENIALVDACVEDFPEGFNEYESCANWDDIDLINDVAKEIKKHTEDFKSKLKKNRSIKRGDK